MARISSSCVKVRVRVRARARVRVRVRVRVRDMVRVRVRDRVSDLLLERLDLGLHLDLEDVVRLGVVHALRLLRGRG